MARLPSEPDPTAGLPASIEQELARRIHVLAAGLTALFCIAYLVALAVRGQASAAAGTLATVAGGGLLAVAASLAVGRRTGRHDRAILVMCWPLFIGVATLTFLQGGVIGTAVWWLPIAPLVALQGGALRSGIAMTSWVVIELLLVQALRQRGLLGAPMATPLGEFQRALAVSGSVICVSVLIVLGLQWRRDLLRRLEAAHRSAFEAMQARARFLATVSHEVRTPLNGIIGAAELLRGARLDTRGEQALLGLRRSADALLALVNDVLNLSRLEAGRMPLDLGTFDPRELAFDAAELFAAQAAERGLALWVHCGADVPAQLVGDPARLRQILHNLIANAVKFTEQGDVQVRVTRQAGPAGADHLRLAVHDTGIGLTEEQRGRLFEAFAQADASTTRRFGGTGLGLAISRELAALMDARIEVESRPGAGSTFALVLPLREPASAVAPPAVQGGIGVAVTSRSARRRDDLVDAIAGRGHPTVALERLPGAAELAGLRAQGVECIVADAAQIRAEPGWAATLEAAGLRALAVAPPGAPALEPPLAQLYEPVRPERLDEALRQSSPRAPAPAPDPPRSALRAAGRRPPHVLLVEDHPVNQLVAQGLLEFLGASVTLAGNGQQALDRLDEEPASGAFDLVLMDCEMPVLDGYATTRALREREAALGWRRVPVLALSAGSEAERDEGWRLAGMDDFVAKPVTLAQLYAALRHWLEPGSPG